MELKIFFTSGVTFEGCRSVKLGYSLPHSCFKQCLILVVYQNFLVFTLQKWGNQDGGQVVNPLVPTSLRPVVVSIAVRYFQNCTCPLNRV